MKKLLIAAVVALTVATMVPTRMALAATGSNICANDPCTSAEVGPFMEDISKECGNLGTCALADIQIVFENVADYILSIVGALVFLMYVVGGFYFLLSGMPGQEKLREKGKNALKVSTIGLIIVFGAFAIMHTVFGILQGSGVGGNYVSCSAPASSVTQPSGECADNSTCTADGLCVSQCLQFPGHETTVDSATGKTVWWECFDSTYQTTSNGVVPGSTETGQCPGPESQVCTQFTYTPT